MIGAERPRVNRAHPQARAEAAPRPRHCVRFPIPWAAPGAGPRAEYGGDAGFVHARDSL